MVKRRELLKSAVVLATGGLSYAKLAASAPGEAAKALFERVAQSYSSMTSYQDNGAVKRWLAADDPPIETEFATLYKGPSRFRFEFSRPHPYPPLRHLMSKFVVGFDGSAAYTVAQAYQKPPELKTRESLGLAIAWATGISSGSAQTIGRLLLPETGGLSILDLLDAHLEEDTAIGNIPCYSVAATYPRGGNVQYTIEKESLLIRRIRTDFGKSPDEEYRENIRVNQPLDDSLFAIERGNGLPGAA